MSTLGVQNEASQTSSPRPVTGFPFLLMCLKTRAAERDEATGTGWNEKVPRHPARMSIPFPWVHRDSMEGCEDLDRTCSGLQPAAQYAAKGRQGACRWQGQARQGIHLGVEQSNFAPRLAEGPGRGLHRSRFLVGADKSPFIRLRHRSLPVTPSPNEST
ncbi:hypothetical protein LZ30DRAFT_771789 [Colletotrichum cereale]|nr:hypothetical protein LZ30DRAFT_771789 [Colletotrichum cereale]